MKNQKGSTFIGLLIIVTIIGILSAIFIPAYQDYLYRGENPNWKQEYLQKKAERQQN